MKKIISAIMALAIALTCTVAAVRNTGVFAEQAEDVPAAEEAAVEPEKVIDYDAMRDSVALEKTVMTIGGKDVTWADFFSLYFLYIREMDSNFRMMKMYYGVDQSWDDVWDAAAGLTYADYVAMGAENEMARMVLYENLAEEKGLTVTEEARAEMDAALLETAQKVLGEDATVEEYVKSLEEYYVSSEMYYRMLDSDVLGQTATQEMFTEVKNALTEEEIISELDKENFMTAKHILFMTVNRDTGESVDEDTAKAAKAKAEELVAELQAIEDDAERKAKFDEYEAEYNEDPGRQMFTDGYTFVPGTMYPEFESATEALADWQVSGIVESTSGYHIIMRLPLSENSLILYTDGNMYAAKDYAANCICSNSLQAKFDALEITWAEDFTLPGPAEFLTEVPAEELPAA